MRRQQGLATLLVTTMVLVVSLLFSLASYKNVLYQIKRAQNEVLVRKAHWLAEGGLECGFAKAYLDNDVSKLSGVSYLQSSCVNPLGLKSIIFKALADGKYTLSSTYESDDKRVEKTLAKTINFGSSISSGALKTTADLFVRGSVTFNPPDPGINTKDGWECAAVRYRNEFITHSTIDNKEFYGKLPYKGFPGGQRCAPGYKTTDALSLKKDFLKDSEFEPFEQLFKNKKQNWEKVRDSWGFTIIPAGTVNVGSADSPFYVSRVVNCGTKIADEIKQGEELIWIDGSCEVGEEELPVLTKEMKQTNGVLLVVHNGIFSIIGSGELKGMLYHFVDGFTSSENHWKKLDAWADLTHTPNDLDIVLDKSSRVPKPRAVDAVYYQAGSITFLGGQIIDAKDQIALFRNGLDFRFDKEAIENPIANKYKPTWQQGSWHDF